jgi:multicomponent Na+:H+ antiporter subunit B
MTFNWRELLYVSFIFLLVGLVGTVLFMTVFEMPVYGEVTNPTNNYLMKRYVDMGVTESGGYNFVTNILLDYRGYDTLLETTVIFTAVMAIIIVWGAQGSKDD